MKEIIDRELYNIEDYLEKYGPFTSPKCWNAERCTFFTTQKYTVTRWDNKKYALFYYDYESNGEVKLYKKD